MKSTSKKKTLLLLAVSAGVLSLGGCKSTATIPVSFVAVTSSEWNASVTFGTYAYKFKGNLKDGKNFVLKGTTQGRASASSNANGRMRNPLLRMGGMGGGGTEEENKTPPDSIALSLDMTEAFIGQSVKATITASPADASNSVEWATSDESIATVSGGTVNPLAEGTVTITATSKYNPNAKASATLTVKKENLAQYDFEIKGTYELEKGYGYILHLEDADKTTIHVDYNKTEGRHTFYYSITANDATSLVKFQAKDPSFAKTLASDYKTWDNRDSKYIFCAVATGNNNSKATAYLYLHSDGSVVQNSPNGAARTITLGKTWSEANDVITIKDGQSEYKSVKSINSEHPGYKIAVGSSTYIYSANPDVRWKKMTPSDFDGVAKYSFSGSYTVQGPDGGTKSVDLNLTPDGKAHMYENGFNSLAEGTWVEEDDDIILTIDGVEYISETNGEGKRTIAYKVETSKGTSDCLLTESK